VTEREPTFADVEDRVAAIMEETRGPWMLSDMVYPFASAGRPSHAPPPSFWIGTPTPKKRSVLLERTRAAITFFEGIEHELEHGRRRLQAVE
jgi:hypothetical protein